MAWRGCVWREGYGLERGVEKGGREEVCRGRYVSNKKCGMESTSQVSCACTVVSR